MKLTKQNHKACLNVIKLLHKIIDNNLPYSQCVGYQGKSSVNGLITDWDTLVKSGKISCLMGYLVADDKFKKSGGTVSVYDILAFNGGQGLNGFIEYVGFDATKIVIGGDGMSAELALDWFVDAYAKELKLS